MPDWTPGYVWAVGTALVSPSSGRVEKLHTERLSTSEANVDELVRPIVSQALASYDGRHPTTEHVLEFDDASIERNRLHLTVAPVCLDVPHYRYLLVWALSNRPSSSGMGPRAFRSLAQAVDTDVAESLGLTRPAGAILGLAMSQQWPKVLRSVADLCSAQAVIVWEYSFRKRLYSSILVSGLLPDWRRKAFRVALGSTMTAGGTLEGLVGLVQPERPYVYYSLTIPEERWPKIDKWIPHDAGFMEAHQFSEFAGWPIMVAGELLGAVTVYSPRPGIMKIDKANRDTVAILFAEYLRGLEAERRIEAVDEEYDAANTAITIGEIASDFIHDGRESIERLALAWNHLVLKPGSDPAAHAVVRDADQEIPFLTEMFRGLAQLREIRRQKWRCEPYSLLRARRAFFEGVVAAIGDGLPLNFDVPRATAGVQVPLDELTFVRVVLNLLKNAARWTRGVRGGAVTLACKVRGDPPQQLIVVVRDNGVGIPEPIQSQVWDRFFSERKAEGGTGLGLHYVHRQVEKVGGSAEVSSVAGSGAVFTLTFPIGR